MASSKADLLALPGEVQDVFGFALFHAQEGRKHDDAKVLRGFGDAAVLEVVEDFKTDTYRAVYTVRFADAVYVLHVFQKKSKKSAELPKRDRELIETRLAAAKRDHEERSAKDRTG